jgi:hypothetical protein
MKFKYDNPRTIYASEGDGPELGDAFKLMAWGLRTGGPNLTADERNIFWNIIRALGLVYGGHEDPTRRDFTHNVDFWIDELNAYAAANPSDYPPGAIAAQPRPPVIIPTP